ncbi:T9SS type A sorting domain-containing protein, partial [Dyadobacter psychrotolerans]
YLGSFESADCNTVSGWAWDKNYPNGEALTVELVEGNTVYATAIAGTYKDYVKTAGYGTGNYGFNIPLPVSLKDGNTHSLSIRIKGSTTLLPGPARAVACGSATSRQSFSSNTIQTIEKQEISLGLACFPNPTDGIIYISYGTSEGQVSLLSISNIVGQVVWKMPVVGIGQTHGQSFDLSTQADGIYLLRLLIDGRSEVKRIMLIKKL